MNTNLPAPQPLPGQVETRVTRVVYHLLVPLMMALLVGLVGQLGLRIVPGWQNGYLVPLGILISFEALLTTRLARTYPQYSPEWFFTRLSEMVVIIVSVKALLYILRGPGQLLEDVLFWDDAFLVTFFTPEMLATSAIILFVWLLSVQFGEYLLDMEESLEELEAESMGYVLRDRAALRRSLQVLIFSIGFLMMALVTILHAETGLMAALNISLRRSILMVITYYLLGFVLLALSQFFIQRARWYMQEIPVNPGVGTRWALSSLGLLALVGLLVIVLPTGYSSAAFAAIRLAVTIIGALITGLVFLLITPLIYLFNYLAGLVGGAPIQLAPVTPPVLPPVEGQDSSLFLQVLKSLFFWTIFLSTIVFSVRYYLDQRRENWESLKKRPGWGWLGRLLAWLDGRVRGVRRGLDAMREVTGEQIAAAQRRLHLPVWQGLRQRLPPRQQVLFIYRAMLRWNARNGIPRRARQTPYEYATTLTALLPASRAEIDAITASFMEARYTSHEIAAQTARQMEDDWLQLRAALRLALNLRVKT